MNASIAAAVVAAVLAASWMLGRRRAPLVRDGDMSAIAALNREQIALVQRLAEAPPALDPPSPSEPAASPLPPPGALTPARRRQATLASLNALYRAPGAPRLEAMRLARQWGDASALPLLRQGLRDADPAVVREAAGAIDRFRAHPTPVRGEPAQRLVPARNRARTR